MSKSKSLVALTRQIIACRACPRLARYIDGIRDTYPAYWCRPVPGFGDPHACVLFLGLAPGRFGSNRTGRMFTGDASGDFLYPALHAAGFASQPRATGADDGLRLRDAWITAVVRCAPPQNKPLPAEIRACEPYWREELRLLPSTRVIVALGRIAHDAVLRHAGVKLARAPFAHGAVHALDGFPVLLDA